MFQTYIYCSSLLYTSTLSFCLRCLSSTPSSYECSSYWNPSLMLKWMSLFISLATRFTSNTLGKYLDNFDSKYFFSFYLYYLDASSFCNYFFYCSLSISLYTFSDSILANYLFIYLLL